jgi:phosphoadenosine phosphosulfate reductase
MIQPTDELLSDLNDRFEDAEPAEILKWAFTNLPEIAIAASFQVGGLVNIHIARQVTDLVPVLFIQTGFHFPETLAFRDRIVAEWGVELIETKPTLGPQRQAAELGPELYRTDPDLCCQLNRVLPLQDVLEGLDGWITGLRRDQGPTRRDTPVFDRQVLHSGKTIWKISPLAAWTGADVWAYAEEHEIPIHPLYEQGYLSIGCAPCTRPVREGEDERAGRWSGSAKTECGIHTFGGAAQARAAG